jgi:UDP-glucose 4-epimerase
MDTYLITGGAGFIGSHLCDELLAAGNKVIVLDDLSTGTLANISNHLHNPHFQFHHDTILNYPLMEKLVQQADYIFHLASVVGVQRVIDSPVNTIEIGARGMNIMLALADSMKKTVLFTSTSEVYGKSIHLPYSEEDDMTFGATHIGRWSYACSKALDEFHALAYHRERQMKIVVVRLFNTAGPRQTGKYGMVLPKFIANALSGKPLSVYGDGSHRRCFGYVKDVTWALKKLIKQPDCYGEVFNVGSHEEISVIELAQLVIKQLNSTSKIIYVPYQEIYGDNFEETINRSPSTKKIAKAIGYAPKTTLSQLIDEIAESIQPINVD